MQTNFYPSPRQAVGIFVMILIASVACYFILLGIDNFVLEIDKYLNSFLMQLIPLLVISYYYIKKRKQRNEDDYAIRNEKVGTQTYLLVFVLTLLFILIIDPIDELLFFLIPPPESFMELMKNALFESPFAFFGTVLVAPIFEELLVRGVILDGFLKRYSPPKAIIWSSIFFGVMHLNPWQAVSAFFAGLLIGWVYYRTKSIIPCILIHLVNNALAFALFTYLPENDLWLSDLFGNTFVFAGVWITLLLVFYVVATRLDCALHNDKVKESV